MDVRVRVGLNLQKARRKRRLPGGTCPPGEGSSDLSSGVELGKRNPSIVVLDRIATALGLDITDLTKK